MGITDTDEWYEILEELNTRLEEIFNDCTDYQLYESLLPRLHQKVEELLTDLEHEKEMIEHLKMND